MIDRYAVIGYPIQHSLSPDIFRAFAKQTQQILDYTILETPLAQFQDTLNSFAKSGGRGLNVTTPFKKIAYSLVHQASHRAQLAQAINIIRFDSPSLWYGDNFDGIGFIQDLTLQYQIVLYKKQILLIGAGGTAHSMILSLIQENPQSIAIVNRTPYKAMQLAQIGQRYIQQHHLSSSLHIQALTFETLSLCATPFDIVINCTNASACGEQLPLTSHIIHSNSCCYDLVYHKTQTAFTRWAQDNGVKQYYNGLGMLIEQAAQGFYLWRGILPKTQPLHTYFKLHQQYPSDQQLISS